MTIAIPKSREREITTFCASVAQVKANGLLQSSVETTGLRGLVKTE